MGKDFDYKEDLYSIFRREVEKLMCIEDKELREQEINRIFEKYRRLSIEEQESTVKKSK